jgi:hypothetical protein
MDFLQGGFSGKKKDVRIPVCLQTNRIPSDAGTIQLRPSQLADVRALMNVSR